MIDRKRIQADGDRLRQMEGDYERAKALIGSDDYDTARLRALERIDAIMQAQAGRLADSAQFVVGAIAEVLHGVRAPLDTIRTYEAARRSLDNLRSLVVDDEQKA